MSQLQPGTSQSAAGGPTALTEPGTTRAGLTLVIKMTSDEKNDLPIIMNFSTLTLE
jgi:hypothetical protein